MIDRDQLEVLGRALADADDATGLPEAFIHPDPVPKNTVFTEDGPVLVDWAGAGRGLRLASLGLVQQQQASGIQRLPGSRQRRRLGHHGRISDGEFGNRLMERLQRRSTRHALSMAGLTPGWHDARVQDPAGT